MTDRVNSSTLLDDRRSAVRALKSLSKKFRYEVGTRSVDALVNALQTERNDPETVEYALEALCNVMSNEMESEESDMDARRSEELGLQFTDAFIKIPDNVALLLSFLQEYDYHILVPAVHLLTLLLRNRTKEVQEIVLANPLGISRMMDLLSNQREIVRNEDLLLLIELTRGNTNIQKIVAFENAFERLFDIIKEEGNSDGGVVVEDCLVLLLNLLRNNTSNQNFLKEGSYIQRLPEYFVIDQEGVQGGWSNQKVVNVHHMLKLVRTLVSPNNPPQQTSACQKLMHQCGLLEKLCQIMMASGVPADVLMEAISTVSEIIRGNQNNQEYFASVVVPSTPPRAAIVVLLLSMFNDKQTFQLRCSILYCFQSFLYKNELGQSQIIQTLLPSAAEINQLTAGQLLCGGLFNPDPLSTWFASICLLHSIVNNNAQKEQLLRVQLTNGLGNPPVALIQQCTNILTQGVKFQTRVGLLQLLCHWLSDSQNSVTYFLHNGANVPYLISQVSASEGDENEMIIHGMCAFLLGILVLFNNNQVSSYHRSDLRQIIAKRIGTEQYCDKLSQISKHESYIGANKTPHLNCREASEVVFDFEFTRLFRKLENEVLKAVTSPNENEEKKTAEQHENVVEQYKLIIREQDSNLNSVRQELLEMRRKCQELESNLDDSRQQVQFLKDQNALLKVQKDTSSSALDQPDGDQKNAESRSYPADLEDKLSVSEEEIKLLRSKVDDLKIQLDASQKEAASYRGRLENAESHIAHLNNSTGKADNTVNNDLVMERNQLAFRISGLEASELALESERIATLEKMRRQEEEMEELKKRAEMFEREKIEIELDREHISSEMETIKKEQEDLLLLLSEQETKIKLFKDRLKELGEKIEDDDDDGAEEDDDDDGLEANDDLE